MLVKLIAHEFKATWRILALLDAVLLVIGIAGFILLHSLTLFRLPENASDARSAALVSSYFTWFIFYVIAVMAANIGTLIYLVVRYYRSLYSPEGYLTFTLPVATPDLLHARMITGYIWLCVAYLLTGLSLLLMFSGFFGSLSTLLKEEFPLREIAEAFSFIRAGGVFLTLLYAIVKPLSTLMVLYLCVSVGQLWQKHKIAGAILCYIGLHTLGRTVSTVTTFYSMFRSFGTDFMQTPDISSYYAGSILAQLIACVIVVCASYLVIRYINEKHVNLD